MSPYPLDVSLPTTHPPPPWLHPTNPPHTHSPHHCPPSRHAHPQGLPGIEAGKPCTACNPSFRCCLLGSPCHHTSLCNLTDCKTHRHPPPRPLPVPLLLAQPATTCIHSHTERDRSALVRRCAWNGSIVCGKDGKRRFDARPNAARRPRRGARQQFAAVPKAMPSRSIAWACPAALYQHRWGVEPPIGPGL